MPQIKPLYIGLIAPCYALQYITYNIIIHYNNYVCRVHARFTMMLLYSTFLFTRAVFSPICLITYYNILSTTYIPL